MKLPVNQFKQALKNGEPQIGLWQGLASAYTVELCAGLGYDWLLIDGEHVPNTVQTILAQLQAMAGYDVAPVVRPVGNDPMLMKWLLDIGTQNFLIPMIATADEARTAVQSVRYPPQGIRGVGTALARAAAWGGVSDYVSRANDEMCVLCQVESAEGLQNLDVILDVEGVDGVFIGPADLAASLGYIANPGHPDVVNEIGNAIKRIVAKGKAAGILQANVAQAKAYLQMGATFVAVGLDAALLRRAAIDLLAEFKDDVKVDKPQQGAAY